MPTYDSQKPVNVQLGTSAPAAIAPEYENLACELSQIHGTVRIVTEASGVHFYMACPTCLEESGEDELFKLHLAFNADKYMRGGMTSAAMCMKHGEVFNLMDLLSMPPLDDRGHEHKPSVVVKKEADAQYLEQDACGRMVPKSPGTVVPVYNLPENHPAKIYLASRRFDVDLLTDQFGITFCEAERSDIFYRKLCNGFRATPQGRVVFYIIQNGVVVGWQARILEVIRDGKVWYYHPYKKAWVPVLKVVPAGKPAPLPGWEDWDPAKYVLAHGCSRNECLMGYDAALAYQKPGKDRWCGLVEGPLDAGRVGPPFMATMGKFFSAAQAKLIVEGQFSKVLYVADDDEAGRKAQDYVRKQFAALDMPHLLKLVNPPPGYKDLGEMPDQASALAYVVSKL